jgi:hypothetical protein
LGPVIDETGQVSSGKLIFSDSAWRQLLGRSPAQLIGEDPSSDKSTLELLTFMEHRMRFLRLSMGFGWCVEGAGPLENGVDVGKYGRKRKKVDVFAKGEEKKLKTEARDGFTKKGRDCDGPDRAIVPKEQKSSDGIGDVGRLCIWCVKM